jgi:hypothetical protein
LCGAQRDSDVQLFLDGLTKHMAALNRTANAAKIDKNIFKDIIGSVVRKMFTYFRWRNNTNVLLPAKGSVRVPVIFNQNFAHSTVSESFVITFDSTDHDIPNQVKTQRSELYYSLTQLNIEL